MTTAEREPADASALTWLLLAVALAASAWIVVRAKPPAEPPSVAVELVDYLPLGPELLVTADVEGLGPVASLELLQAGGSVFLGLKEACGFEPLLAVRRVALAMPRGEPDKATDFAVLAETSLEPEAVLRCAETMIRRGGGVPVRSSVGAFRSVRDQQKPLGEVAIRSDGLFVYSGGQYFRDVIDAASGARAGDEVARLRSKVHQGIRRRLAPSQLQITMLVGPRLPLPGVQALGVGLNVGRELKLRGYVVCPSAAGCQEAQQLLERFRSEAGADPSLAWLGHLRVVPRDAELTLTGDFPREQLGPLLAQLLAP